jgi:DNA-binding HxlR family transcriptional regulator
MEQENIKVYNQQEQFRALQDTLYVIGGKWTIPVINSLCNGNKRFKEIERSLQGITKRMLSATLRELELNQVLIRTVQNTTPVLIEYNLTPYCKTFAPIIVEMIKWGIEHRQNIVRAMTQKV